MKKVKLSSAKWIIFTAVFFLFPLVFVQEGLADHFKCKIGEGLPPAEGFVGQGIGFSFGDIRIGKIVMTIGNTPNSPSPINQIWWRSR